MRQCLAGRCSVNMTHSIFEKMIRIKLVKSLETKKLKDLPVGSQYIIVDMKAVDTKYGRSIIAILKSEVTGEEFKVFLPKRYADILSNDEIIDDFLAEAKYLIYMGLDADNNILLDFRKE